MKQLTLRDLVLLRSIAVGDLVNMPSRARLNGMSRDLKPEELLSLSYFNAVVSILNQKGLLKEEVSDMNLVEFDINDVEPVE